MAKKGFVFYSLFLYYYYYLFAMTIAIWIKNKGWFVIRILYGLTRLFLAPVGVLIYDKPNTNQISPKAL